MASQGRIMALALSLLVAFACLASSARGDCPDAGIRCTNAQTGAVLGTITIGQCFNLVQNGCQPDHCPGNSPGKRCTEMIPGCTVGGVAICEGTKTSG